ncbi:MAG: hypothetical protein VZS44_00615 [Bacilli bacterium]|nr:hypothetical protein [Bacilli bacterium]
MIKESDKYSDIEKIVKMLDGTSFAIHEANRDKENFEKYKNGNTEELSEETIKDMRLLQLLQRLGYPMEELGTYLFKDVIAEVYNSIQDESGKKDIDKCRSIMVDLNNPFSNLYHYIAREWKELGIKSFHLFIKKATDKIDYNSIDKGLSKKIYGILPEDNNYGLHAFQIAAYALDESSYVDTLQYQQPKTKELKLNDN